MSPNPPTTSTPVIPDWQTKYVELHSYVMEMEESLTRLKSDFEGRIPTWTRALGKLDALEITSFVDVDKVNFRFEIITLNFLTLESGQSKQTSFESFGAFERPINDFGKHPNRYCPFQHEKGVD